MDQVASNVADYVSAQQSVAAALPAAGTAWLDSSRDQARTTLAAVGLPSTRQEDWKYTNIKPITRSLFSPVSRPSRWNDQDFVADAQVSGLDSHRLVFADGILVPELSQCDGLPAGATGAGMADILQRDAKRARREPRLDTARLTPRLYSDELVLHPGWGFRGDRSRNCAGKTDRTAVCVCVRG